MSATLAPAPTGAPQTRTHQTPERPLAGGWVLLRFALRRNRTRLVVWWLVVVGMLAYIAAFYKDQFSNPKALQDFIDIGTGASMEALVGHLSNPVTLGAAVWVKGWMFLGVMLAVGMLFLVTHNLRADEEAGRIELFRSRPLGLHTQMVVTAVVTSGLSLAVALGSFGALAGLGIDGVEEAALFGASIGSLGLFGAGLGLLTNQVAPTARGANGLGAAVIGVCYAVRLVGDLGGGGLTWASPIGWGEKTDPWGADRWWPLALVVALATLCAAAAWALEARRDHGAGLIAPRSGAPTASKSLTTVAGLGLRLQRGALIGWAVALVLSAALFGSIVDQMTELVQDITLEAFRAGIIDLFVAMLSLVVGVVAIQSASHLRTDEAQGTLEPQLAGKVNRVGWALRRLAVTGVAVVVLLAVTGATMGSVYGQSVDDSAMTGRLTGAMLVYLPACAIMVGVVVLGLGWWPRVATPVAWGLVAAMFFLLMFGADLGLPSWVMNALPFTGTPSLASDAMSWPPVVVMSLVAVAMITVGLAGFRRRDIPA